MPKIMVTGVNGFVGKHLVRELVARKCTVTGVGRDKNVDKSLENIVSNYYSCDLTDKSAVAILPLDSIDAVINLAGLAKVGESFDKPDFYKHVNVGVLSVLSERLLALSSGARVIAVSTGAVYDPGQPMPLHEGSILLDLRKIARSQGKSARVESGLTEGEVALATSKEGRPLSAEISWSGDGGALRKSSITDDIEPVMTIEPLTTFVTDTVADTEQDFDTQIETPNVGLFEEYLGSLEVIDTIGNLEEIRETASRQPIEKSLAELITLIQETSKTPEMQEITNLIQEIDQLFTVDNLRITEASPLAPEIEEKIIRLFELLGRRSPQDALDELIVRHDIDFLVQAIEYLTELANEDNQQEFLFSRTKTVIPANIIDPIAIRVGRIIVRLVKTGLKNLQPITVE